MTLNLLYTNAIKVRVTCGWLWQCGKCLTLVWQEGKKKCEIGEAVRDLEGITFQSRSTRWWTYSGGLDWDCTWTPHDRACVFRTYMYVLGKREWSLVLHTEYTGAKDEEGKPVYPLVHDASAMSIHAKGRTLKAPLIYFIFICTCAATKEWLAGKEGTHTHAHIRRHTHT